MLTQAKPTVHEPVTATGDHAQLCIDGLGPAHVIDRTSVLMTDQTEQIPLDIRTSAFKIRPVTNDMVIEPGLPKLPLRSPAGLIDATC